MKRLLVLISSLRLAALAFSVPYAMMWSHADRSGGVLMAVAHALMLLYFLVTLTDNALDEGHDPRVALIRDRSLYNRGVTGVARVMLGMLSVLSGLLLLVSTPWAGVAVLVATLLITVTAGPLNALRGRRFELAELTWPLAILILPVVLIKMFARQAAADDTTTQVLNPGVIPAATLGATMLAGYLLLCMLRDEAADRGIGLRTTPTLLGRKGACATLLLWFGLAILLAGWGASRGYWHWSVTAVTGFGAIASAFLAGSRNDGWSVGVWWLAHLAAAIIMWRTV